MSPNLAELMEEWIAAWQASPAALPQLGHRFTPAEQAERESYLEEFLGIIQAEARSLPRTRTERKAALERITAAFERFARTALHLRSEHLDLLLRGGFSAMGAGMARQARRFDAGVTTADILQACRNAWTACGLQVLLGGEMRLTASIFAYSMLYPYTDNYMDDPRISREMKAGFSMRFGRRLAGEGVAPANGREETIWRLVELIEEQYDRMRSPQVFEALLMIHGAQEKSLRLLRRPASERPDVLRLSFEKGGTSVLADGFLAAGSLSREQAQFVFGWGVLLQLADDLEDVREDCRNGVLTIFSESARREPLDPVTSRTLHFGQQVMQRLPASSCAALEDLIRRSSWTMLLRCAGEAGELYSAGYLAELESYSPFRFSFLNRRREMMRRAGHLQRLFEAFLEGDEDEPVFPLIPSGLMLGA